MIKRLQKRFVFISICSVAIVLLIILGAINLYSFIQIVENADSMLELVSKNAFIMPDDHGGNGGNGVIPDENRWQNGKNLSPETPYMLRYFTVTFTEDGQVSTLNVDKIAAVNEEQASNMALDTFENGRAQGFDGVYRYLRIELSDGGCKISYLDCSTDLNTFYTLLKTSIAVSLGGTAAVLLLLILFSKKAIGPLAESYEKQKHFITDASHELKTPLTIIDANTEIIEMEHGESHWTKSIRAQVKRLADLTGNLVSLSRMDEGDQKPLVTEFSLSDAVKETMEGFETRAEQSGKHIEMNVGNNISYEGNEDSIRKLIGILADNALKYSPDGSVISLNLSKSSKGIVLTITNPTIGMTAGSHDELFERFYRGDSSRSSELPGYGIGLSIAQSIVIQHNGKIRAISDGASLKFTIQL